MAPPQPPVVKKARKHLRDSTESPTQERTQLKFRSPAEFFAENKNIAGFDNDGRSLYTTVRELVENGIDAAEVAQVLPLIEIRLEELSRARFYERVGMEGTERRDETLYKDFHVQRKLVAASAAAARRKRARENGSTPAETTGAIAEPTTAAEPETDAANAHAGGNAANDAHYYVVTVRDNGSGMPHDAVPSMLGVVLAGTKYVVQQSRGKFGLGSKMALLWSKMSTGLPIRICTTEDASRPLTLCVLDIDIAKNQPDVLVYERVPNAFGFRGTEVSVTIRGNWKTYRPYILQYLRHMAIITPYAEFGFQFVAEQSERSFQLHFARRSERVPPPPRQAKHHPSSVNQLVLQQLLDAVDPKTSLIAFLTRELSSISRELAKKLVAEMGAPFRPDMRVSELDGNCIRKLCALLGQAHFPPPTGDCLSPAGEYNLRLGIMKELQPDMVATFAEPVGVFEGHPFIVEVGVSLGGVNVKTGLNVYRFANRIPLLFEGGNDVVTKTAHRLIPWNNYKISATADKVGVFCSIVSTKCPFKGTGKEYIGADAEPIQKAVRHAIMQCCQQLRIKLLRHVAMRDRYERKRRLAKYAPNVSRAIYQVLQLMADASRQAPEDAAGGAPETQLLQQVRTGMVTEQVLQHRLLRHVEETDQDDAVQRAASGGREAVSTRNVFFGIEQATTRVAMAGAGLTAPLLLLRSAMVSPPETAAAAAVDA
ncbi:hypothetical protein CDCA_CDCA02G0524 [Cyanidium caldarium]|uniref:DNA topoisomerase VI subunit B transducer domain-containing protein n=1 Tax=Cyanidium caldarium TaxID=2771 RepID=A0AAV9IQT2_CYACA|nr:hypothetical protein CDCA_CDCA02G0524 [Cyanidium caldarium]